MQVSSAGVASSWLWDGMFGLPELVLERDGAGATVRGYVHGHGPVSVSAGGAESFFGLDAIGSVVNVTSAAGALEWELAYDPFGGERVAAQAPGAAANPLRFAGEYLDPETGLYHLRARQYDPQTGRFLALDPLPPTLTDPYVASYLYVRNRPTVLIDPSGRKGVWPEEDGNTCGSLWCWLSDPNNVWDSLRYSGAAAACYEGARVGARGGALWAGVGCLSVAIAFDLSAERSKRIIEEELGHE